MTGSPIYAIKQFIKAADSGLQSDAERVLDRNARCELELRHLGSVKQLLTSTSSEKLHLIEIAAAFRIGQDPCIMMPYFQLNLYDFLRRSPAQPSLPRSATDAPSEGLVATTYLPSTEVVQSLFDQMRAIGKALQSLHSMPDPLFHLDVHPANILVNQDPKNPAKLHFVLCDFDRSRTQSEIMRSPKKGTPGHPRYVPPGEQEHGDRCRFWYKYDVWSYGAVLFMCIAYTVNGPTEITVLDKAIKDLGPLWHKHSSLGYQLRPLVETCMTSYKEASEQRIQDMPYDIGRFVKYVVCRALQIQFHLETPNALHCRPDMGRLMQLWGAAVQFQSKPPPNRTNALIQNMGQGISSNRVGSQKNTPRGLSENASSMMETLVWDCTYSRGTQDSMRTCVKFSNAEDGLILSVTTDRAIEIGELVSFMS